MRAKLGGFALLAPLVGGALLIAPTRSAAQIDEQPAAPAEAPAEAQAVDEQPAQPQVVYVQPTSGAAVQPVYVQPVQPIQPAPPRETRTEERPQTDLIVAGTILFGISYLVNAAFVSPFAGVTLSFGSYGGGSDPAWESIRWTGLVPVLGPWIQFGLIPAGRIDWAVYFSIDGLLQSIGAILFILGFALPETVEVYADRESGVRVALGAGPGSLSLQGTF